MTDRMEGSVSTTADKPDPNGFLLRFERTEDGGWIVSDLVTTRFGVAATLPDAVTHYFDDLKVLLSIEGPMAPALAREADWAKAVTR